VRAQIQIDRQTLQRIKPRGWIVFESLSAILPKSGACPFTNKTKSSNIHSGHGLISVSASCLASNGAPPDAASHSAAFFTPLLSSHCRAMAVLGEAKGRRRQRESKVGSSRSGASATNRKMVEAGGSSKTFSNVLPEIVVSAYSRIDQCDAPTTTVGRIVKPWLKCSDLFDAYVLGRCSFAA